MLTHRARTFLGNIPQDWGCDLVGKLLSDHQGGDWGDDNGEVALCVLRSTNFTDRGTLDFEDVATRYFARTKAESMGLRKHDLLLERSGGGPTQPVGRIGFITEDLPDYWFSNFVQLLKPNSDKIEPEFLGWVLFELNRSGIVERLQHQTQMRNLDYRDYLRIFVPVPPRPEQQRIAVMLRTANDALALAEKKLTAACRLKTALMQQLFTRGIPGRHTQFTRTKIGEIPNEWDVVPLGQLATAFSGVALNSDREPKSNPHQYLTVIHVQRERLDLRDVRHMEIFPQEVPDALIEAGDILVVEGHANSSEIGRAAIATEQVAGFAYQNHLFRVRLYPDVDFNRLFLLGVLNSERVRRHWNAICNTSSGLNTINHRGLRRLLIQQPKKDEQDGIAEMLSAANDNIAACEAEIVALEKLKRSMLQNLITGRVRVRIEP